MNVKLSHDIIKNYLAGQTDKKSREKINSLKKNDAVYSLFFSLIDPFAGVCTIKDNKPGACSFNVIEDDLSRITAGKVDRDCARDFVQKIAGSRLYYERLIIKLAQIAVIDEKTKIPALQQIVIKNNDQILKELGIISSQRKNTLSIFHSTIQRWFTFPIPRRIPVYAMVFVLCIATGLGIIHFNHSKNSFDNNFVYDDRVPYEYDQALLRNADSGAIENQHLTKITKEFLLGLSFYSTKDYTKADAVLDPLTQDTESLRPTHPAITRDLYFYAGLTQLALATSKKQPLRSEDRKQHIANTLYYVKMAAAIAKNMNQNNNRENYFLGIGFYLAAQPDSALTRIGAIPADSPFHNKGDILKHHIIQSY